MKETMLLWKEDMKRIVSAMFFTSRIISSGSFSSESDELSVSDALSFSLHP